LEVINEEKIFTIQAIPLVFEELKNLELNKVTNTIFPNHTIFSEKTNLKLFVKKKKNQQILNIAFTILL